MGLLISSWQRRVSALRDRAKAKGTRSGIIPGMCLSNDGRKAWKFMGIKYGRTRSWRGASIQIIQVKKDLDFTSGKRKATERF